MQELDKTARETILKELDKNGSLFSKYSLKEINGELNLLGVGGFSYVYEMNEDYALKVMGFSNRALDSDEFKSTTQIQLLLEKQSDYIMRIVDAKELSVDSWSLQLILMDKLDSLVHKDRFNNTTFTKKNLNTEAEVIKIALEIGQALAVAHSNNYLHRDIKLENIFWNNKKGIYQLGDFGIAKWAESGSAETVVYTEGYGAPEIERRLNDNYDTRADIYSFGITLYVLLNNLKFPGSQGYYPKPEIQYNPDFIFPAPLNASEGMARIIRKMCSYYPEDRYQSINEVLIELTKIIGDDVQDELLELADIVTETYRENKDTSTNSEISREKLGKRARQKQEAKLKKQEYNRQSMKYCIILTACFLLLYCGFSPDKELFTNWLFFVLPIGLLYYALLQKIKEFNIIIGIAIIVFVGFSISNIGLVATHIIVLIGVISTLPAVSVAGVLATGIWMLLDTIIGMDFLRFLNQWYIECACVFVVLYIVLRYFNIAREYRNLRNDK